jgi:hypothetical protein
MVLLLLNNKRHQPFFKMNEDFFDVAVQTSYTEKGEIYFDCLNCGEAIYNPICPRCLFKAFEQWAQKYPQIRRKIIPKIKSFLKKHEDFEKNSQQCIICRKKSAYICPYCFTEFILNILKQEKINEKEIKDYLEFFDFDLGDFNGHWGYYKEEQDIGIR